MSTSVPFAYTAKRGTKLLVLLGVIAGLLFAVAPPASASPSIDSTFVCVEQDGTFRFVVDFTDPDDSGVIIFRLNADDGPFVATAERFAVNFDGTGEPTNEQPPEVETFGSPPFDRWVDGAVGTFSATSVDGEQWSVSASLAPGPDAFEAGDTVWGAIVRTETDPDAIATGLTVANCTPSDTTTTTTTTTTSTTAAPTTSSVAPSSTLPETGLGDGIRGFGVAGALVLIAGLGLVALAMVRTRQQE